jgi:hypothetical protein
MGVHHVDYTGTRVKNLSRRVEEVGVRLRKSEMSNNKLGSLPDRAERRYINRLAPWRGPCSVGRSVARMARRQGRAENKELRN